MALVKRIISEVRFVDLSVMILNTQLFSFKPKLERSFMRTEEDTKQQLDENFKWCHKWLTIHIQSRKANKVNINQLSLTLTSRFYLC